MNITETMTWPTILQSPLPGAKAAAPTRFIFSVRWDEDDDVTALCLSVVDKDKIDGFLDDPAEAVIKAFKAAAKDANFIDWASVSNIPDDIMAAHGLRWETDTCVLYADGWVPVPSSALV